MDNIKVMKKDGTTENFDINKILKAVGKSAQRVNKELDIMSFKNIFFEYFIKPVSCTITVQDLHRIVENIATKYDEQIGASYRNFRNYKELEANLFIDINRQADKVMYEEDKENANVDSALISTKKSAIAGSFLKEKYQHFNLSIEERQAIKDGFIYIHDLSDRGLNSLNCTLFDSGNIMKGGFEMADVPYDEPSYISSACAVLGDIIMASSAQMYGGHTTHEIDKLLIPYCVKSYTRYLKEEIKKYKKYSSGKYPNNNILNEIREEAHKLTIKELEKGLKGLEVKLNSVVSARGSFPFTTFTFGASKNKWGVEISLAILRTRMKGHGKFNKSAIFPKLIFLYDEHHEKGQDFEYVYDKAIECSQLCMYPDYMSYKRYKRHGVWVGAMGKHKQPN